MAEVEISTIKLNEVEAGCGQLSPQECTLNFNEHTCMNLNEHTCVTNAWRDLTSCRGAIQLIPGHHPHRKVGKTESKVRGLKTLSQKV
jgi:hypothetical protein